MDNIDTVKINECVLYTSYNNPQCLPEQKTGKVISKTPIGVIVETSPGKKRFINKANISKVLKTGGVSLICGL